MPVKTEVSFLIDLQHNFLFLDIQKCQVILNIALVLQWTNSLSFGMLYMYHAI